MSKNGQQIYILRTVQFRVFFGKGRLPKKNVKSLVSEGSKKPNLYFGVKNGLKWPKKM